MTAGLLLLIKRVPGGVGIACRSAWHRLRKTLLVATRAGPADKCVLFSFHFFCFPFSLQANIHYTSTPTAKDDTLSSVSGC